MFLHHFDPCHAVCLCITWNRVEFLHGGSGILLFSLLISPKIDHSKVYPMHSTPLLMRSLNKHIQTSNQLRTQNQTINNQKLCFSSFQNPNLTPYQSKNLKNMNHHFSITSHTFESILLPFFHMSFYLPYIAVQCPAQADHQGLHRSIKNK